VLLKLLANLRPDCGYGEVQGVHGLNLGGRSEPFSVGPDDARLCIGPIDGGARALREVSGIYGHLGSGR
jgi:hypothetical protein